MNSSTGDFSQLKKISSTDEFYTRGSQSCVKVKPQFSKKLMNLKPLNLDEIKKEIEESWEEQSKEEDSKVDDICRTEQSVLPLNNKLNFINESENENGQQVLREHHEIKSNANLSVIHEGKENTVVPCRKKNDSFDLDFSALILQTPIKECGSNASRKSKPEHIEKQHEFLTPKVNNFITAHNSVSKKLHLKTPVNSFTNLLKTPYTPSASSVTKKASTQRIFNLGLEEANHKSNQRQEFITLNGSNCDTFRKVQVNNTEYLILNELGKGGSSEVFHGYNIENKCHVAIKCVSLHNSSSANSYVNEVKLLQQLQGCEKIIKMYDYQVIDSQKKLLVVLEKGGEDLSTILKRLATQQSHLPMYMLLFYWMEMLYAVKQIHFHGIIHSDLKPANFLKADGGLKLIDFGIATSVQTDMTSVIKSVPEGSCNYISPEALNNDSANAEIRSNSAKYKVHFKSDVWSLGCILYQFVYRRTPFEHIKQLWSKLAAIMNPDYKIEYPDVDWVSPKIIKTIQKCLQHDVRKRPSVDELVAEYESILNNI